MSIKVFEVTSPRSVRKAQAVADACNHLQNHLLNNGKAGTIIGYEVDTAWRKDDANQTVADWAIDIIYAERGT